MKIFLLALLFSVSAFASPTGTTSAPVAQVLTLYSSTNVGGTPVKIYGPLTSSVNLIDIFDSSGQTMQISYIANGVTQIVATIYPGGNGQIRTSIPNGANVYLVSLSSTATAGESVINLFN